jgi:hypothetical protein
MRASEPDWTFAFGDPRHYLPHCACQRTRRFILLWVPGAKFGLLSILPTGDAYSL